MEYEIYMKTKHACGVSMTEGVRPTLHAIASIQTYAIPQPSHLFNCVIELSASNNLCVYIVGSRGASQLGGIF